jgi:hypothetical protein
MHPLHGHEVNTMNDHREPSSAGLLDRAMLRPEQIAGEDAQAMAEAGVLLGSENRSGTMVVRDQQPVLPGCPLRRF